MNSIDLFTGAGGLALGLSNAGFRHLAVIDWDKYACDTIRENQEQRLEPVVHWPLYQHDVQSFDFRDIVDHVDLVAGGPPCQPFSLGGKHRGHRDHRDMFPAAVRAIRQLRPRVFLLENVKGLTRQSFAKYFEYILLQLTYPNLTRRTDESWTDHLSRLERYHTRGRHRDLFYRVTFRLLNAADYGVPQRRDRVIIVGFRSDIREEWSFPAPSHSYDSLLQSQWISSEYWERHRIAKKHRPDAPPNLAKRIERLRSNSSPTTLRPWKTVRDAICDLPDPHNSRQSCQIANHDFNPGARSYPGHTGSPLDQPAKTLKAGDHGVPGGENMLAYPDGTVRYFTIRESCRLQNFPDEFRFHGSWTESMRQLGNAVPVKLAEVLGRNIRSCLDPNLP